MLFGGAEAAAQAERELQALVEHSSSPRRS
jgi:hypothetical protein